MFRLGGAIVKKGKLELEPNEWFVEEADATDDGKFFAGIVNVVLTSSHIIITPSLSSKARKYRLNTLKRTSMNVDRLVRLNSNKGYQIALDFQNGESELLRFGSKSATYFWAENILNVALGNVDDINYEGSRANTTGDSLKAGLETLQNSFGGFRSKKTPSQEQQKIVKTCTGCGASVSGKVGAVVKCEYCGTPVSL